MHRSLFAVRRRVWLGPLAVLAMGLVVSGFIEYRLQNEVSETRTARLDRWVERTQPELIDALTRPAYGLGGARGAHAASGGRLTADSLARYVRSRDLPREFPGVIGFGLIERVERSNLGAWTLDVRRDAGPDFQVRSVGSASDLFVIRGIEPVDSNRAARGFDVGSEALRRAAAERAYRTGEVTLTGPVRLLQAPEQPGALVMMPLFASGTSRADGSPVVGLVYAPILYSGLLKGLLPDTDPHIRLELLDLEAGPDDQLLYTSTTQRGTGLAQDVVFQHAGRKFRARYEALPALYAGLQGLPVWVPLIAGVALSLMAAALTLLLTGSRARALDLAQSMAGELTRLAMVARLTGNAVVVTDPEGRVQWANPAFEELTGYPLSKLRGQRPGALLQFDKTDPASIRAMGDAQRRRVGYKGEVLNRDARGREYWVELEIQPMLGERHVLEGFIAVQADVTEARLRKQDLLESQGFLHRTNRVAGVGGWELDIQSGAVSWSAETRRLHDVPDDFVPDITTGIQFYDEAARPVISAAVTQAVTDGTGWDLELPLVSYTGRRFWARAVGEVLKENGRAARIVGAFQDITTRKEAEISLAHSTRLIQTTLRSIGDAVITTDTAGNVLWLNPVAERLTGWTQDAARGVPAYKVLRLELEGRGELAPCPIDACLRDRVVVGLAPDTMLVTRDGSRRYAIEDSSSPILDEDGHMHGVVMVFADVTEKRRMAQEMSFRARHDALTGLANRGELEVRLRESLDRLQSGGASGALLFLDLDHFKVVNDSCGHSAGDVLLGQVSGILTAAVRKDDFVARFGGDEFAILLERCPLDKAQAIARSICDSIDAHRYAAEDGRRFRVGASIGVVPMDARWLTVASILQVADEACYAAKNEGRGRVVLREGNGVQAVGDHASAWGARIEAALDNDAFELYAQRLIPIDGTHGGLHCEVLLRMRGDDGRFVSPAVFMPSAERYQLASRIDRWVLRRVLDVLRGVELGGIERIAVNLSGQSVGDSEFHRFVRRSLLESGIRPQALMFEITETAAITNLIQAGRFIEDIRSLGVQVALDDFGAGASSFGYLKQLHVDVLKIDGQFVKGLLHSPLDESAVRCFADVARVLGLQTVAEHVEDAATSARLTELGIGLAQGYHYHKPERFEDVLALSATLRSAVA